MRLRHSRNHRSQFYIRFGRTAAARRHGVGCCVVTCSRPSHTSHARTSGTGYDTPTPRAAQPALASWWKGARMGAVVGALLSALMIFGVMLRWWSVDEGIVVLVWFAALHLGPVALIVSFIALIVRRRSSAAPPPWTGSAAAWAAIGACAVVAWGILSVAAVSLGENLF